MAIAPDEVSYKSHGLRLRVQGDSGLFDVTRGFQESIFLSEAKGGVYVACQERTLISHRPKGPNSTADLRLY